MTIPLHNWPATLDRTDAYQYEDDYSDVWEALKQPTGRLKALDRFKQGRPLRNPTYYWTEDITKVRRVRLEETLDASATTAYLVIADAAYVQNGDILLFNEEAAATVEMVQIDGEPNTTTGVISIVRGVGDTTGAIHTDAGYAKVIRSRPEGSEEDMAEFKGTARLTNYTSIISHTVSLTGSAMEGKPRAYQQAELDRQEAEILLSLKTELEDLLLWGSGEARSASLHGQMRGIFYQIVTTAGSNIGASAVNWGYKLVDSRLNWIAQEGMVSDSSDLVIICPATMYSAAGYWGASACTRVASDKTYGFEINMFHSTLGLDVPMIWAYSCPTDVFMIVDLSRFEYNPLGNRSLIRWVKPKGIVLNDYESRRLLMEFGCKLRYPDKAHWVQKLVTIP